MRAPASPSNSPHAQLAAAWFQPPRSRPSGTTPANPQFCAPSPVSKNFPTLVPALRGGWKQRKRRVQPTRSLFSEVSGAVSLPYGLNARLVCQSVTSIPRIRVQRPAFMSLTLATTGLTAPQDYKNVKAKRRECRAYTDAKAPKYSSTPLRASQLCMCVA